MIKSTLAILRSYVEEKGMEIGELETQSSEQLNCTLQKFYAGVKKMDGERCAKKSMITVRYGL